MRTIHVDFMQRAQLGYTSIFLFAVALFSYLVLFIVLLLYLVGLVQRSPTGCFAFLWFVASTVCHGLFALPLGVIGRLCPTTVAISRYHQYYCMD